MTNRIMTGIRLVPLAAILCLIAAVPGCSDDAALNLGRDVTAPPRPPIDPIDRRVIEVTGVLTEEGVECPALRSDDGTLYTLAGEVRIFEIGTHVRVVGRIAEVSFCQQGTTLNVVSIVEDGTREQAVVVNRFSFPDELVKKGATRSGASPSRKNFDTDSGCHPMFHPVSPTHS